MIELRNTTFTGNPQQDAALSGENARDANSALRERLAGFTYGPFHYTAFGATSNEIPIKSPDRPVAVLLVNCYALTDPTGLVGAVGALTFRWDSATNNAYVTEPYGLTANIVYALTFLVIRQS